MSDSSLFRHRQLLFGAVGVFLAAFTVAVSVWAVLRNQPPSLIRLVPADRTLALLMRVWPDDVRAFATITPILRTVPEAEGLRSIALLELPDGSIGWVALDETEGSGWFTRSRAVATSGPAVDRLLGSQSPPFTATPFYTALSAYGGNRSSAFLSTRLLLPLSSSGIDRAIAPLLGNGTDSASFVLLRREPGGWFAAFFRPHAGSTLRAAPHPARSPDGSTLSLGIGDPLGAALVLTDTLDADERTLLVAFARTWFQERLGSSVSRADLAYLLGSPTTLHVTTHGTGSLSILIRGRSEDSARLERTLRRLTDGATPALHHRIVERRFEQGFQSRIITADTQTLEPWRETRGGWHAWGVRDAGSGGLFVALRGREYLVSGQFAALREAMQSEGGAELTDIPSVPGTRIAWGRTPLPLLRSLLPAMTGIPLHSSLLPLLEQSDDTVHWAMGQAGRVTTVRITAAP